MTDFPLPHWTAEITETFVTGEDMLGVEGSAQAYQQEYIPGIITVTDRARYYSFYAWVLYRYIHMPGSTLLMDDFKGEFFRRHEMAFLLAAFSHHYPESILSGLIGSGVNSYKVRGWWEKQDPVSLDTHYFENKLGGFGQYYNTVMKAMGIIADPENSKVVYRLTDRGNALAEAYEQSIQNTKYLQELNKEGVVTWLKHTDATDLGQVSCICPPALTSGGDLPLLRNAFFRFDQRGEQNPHVLRRQALGLALEIVEKGNGAYTFDMLRQVLYLGEYSEGSPYIPSSELTDIAQRWRMVEVRHLFTFGLQALWAAFLLHLSNQPQGMSLEQYLNWATKTLSTETFSSPLGSYLSELCIANHLPGSWGDQHQNFDTACRTSSPENELFLFVRATSHKSDPAELLRIGTRILSQHFLRFLVLHETKDKIWLDMANRLRLPMTGYFNEMQRYLESSDWKVGDWLSWIYRQYILGQHQYMALEKLRYQGYDTFKFLHRDGRFYWPFSKQNTYREPIRLAANRMSNATTMLIDLGMIDSQDGSHLFLTDDGETALQQIKDGRFDS